MKIKTALDYFSACFRVILEPFVFFRYFFYIVSSLTLTIFLCILFYFQFFWILKNEINHVGIINIYCFASRVLTFRQMYAKHIL
jgi:hypothetical protein